MNRGKMTTPRPQRSCFAHPNVRNDRLGMETGLFFLFYIFVDNNKSGTGRFTLHTYNYLHD